MKTEFNSSEILLTFSASRSKSRYINVVNESEKEMLIYMVTPATFEAVKNDRIKNLTFVKNPTPLLRPADAPATATAEVHERIKAQQEAYDGGLRAYSCVPTTLEETELVDLERKAKTISFKVTIKKGEIELSNLEKEVA